MATVVKETLVQFCAGTSLRGAAKLVKAPTRPLRILWAAYICAMAAALAACIFFIAKDYLKYKTIIQTTIILNDDSIAIPAVTICSHYPFSATAGALWSSGRVLSPSNFSRSLRRSAHRLFNASEFLLAETILASDTKRVYYQSISHADAVNVSFSVSQMFVFCITGTGAFIEISDWQDCSLLLKRVSLPTYFNCYQVQAPRDIDWLTLVLRVASGSPSPYEEAFVQDVFEQADGIRLQVHENNTYPEPIVKGIHVEPGKLIEISYKSVRWIEVDSPADACMPAEAADQWQIRDLDQHFAYSYEACLGQELGRLALQRCGCHYAKYLRSSGLPNDTHRYCGDIRSGVEQLLRNARCLRDLELESHRKRLSNRVCLMPCHFHYFDTVASKTVWRTTEWQLHWLMKHSRCFRDIDEASQRLQHPGLGAAEKLILKARLDRAVQTMKRFFESENITHIANEDGDKKSSSGSSSSASTEEAGASQEPVIPTVDNNFAYLILRRQSRNTIQKSETLSLGLSALMSQIGGLSSLFLGLTCAFLVELLELGMLGRHRMKQQQQRRRQHSKDAGDDGEPIDGDRNVKEAAAAADDK